VQAGDLHRDHDVIVFPSQGSSGTSLVYDQEAEARPITNSETPDLATLDPTVAVSAALQPP
jgi:hypothetical protein